MPKLQHTFVQGKMNKDLDERLVPNGQYRDAQNIQISTSEGSDVGAVENVLGNTKKNLRSTNPDVFWPSGFGLTNPVCIGAVRDTQNEKIYWFIKSDGVDAIAEYDQSTNIIAPVIVDTQGVLNFVTSNLITGVNILEGQLAWTDDFSEPKKIIIGSFKAGSTDFLTHTSIYGRDFIESDVTVIKSKPNNAPTLALSSTLKTGSGLGCGVNEVTVEANFGTTTTGDNFVLPETGDFKTIQFKGVPDWAIGDIVIFSASVKNDKNFEDEYWVRAQVENIVTSGFPPVSDITFSIQAISQNLLNQTYTWTVVLEEEPVLFPDTFPRFAYRWKYIDGEYSVYSPFSDVAFIGNDFSYNPAKGINKGMKNFVRRITLSGFTTPPANVEEIEILYKEGNSTAIYKVDTIDPADTSFEIKSKIFGSVVDPTQLLRPYDNVPVRAKAQEIIGNRLVYGNYTQNNEMQSGGVKVIPSISAGYSSINHSDTFNPLKSAKSLRNYQLGVVYLDKYGRETPVFTSTDAAVYLPITVADKTNKLTFDISSDAPDFATHYKVAIKETSNPYYNIALDRFYKADDGNVWLSFVSADRNKISEGSFIYLKKEHDSDNAIAELAEYKVLDISNEAPRDVSQRLVEKGTQLVLKKAYETDDDENVVIRFHGPTYNDDPEFYSQWNGGKYIRFIRGNNTDASMQTQPVTDIYEVKSGGPTGVVNTVGATEYAEYMIVLADEKRTDAFWIDALTDDVGTYTALVYEYEQINSPEFLGKFFVKINKDFAFDRYILKKLHESNPLYDVEYSQLPFSGYPSGYDSNDDPPILTWNTLPAAGNTTMSISYGYEATPYDATGNYPPQLLFIYGLKPGKYVRFPNSDKEKSYYKIKSISDTLNGPNINGHYEIERVVTFESAIDASSFTDYRIETNIETRDWNRYFEELGDIFASTNPAVFETKPLETAELEIYYDATDNLDIASHGTQLELNWFNCYSFGNGVESDRINDDFNAQIIGKGVKANAEIDEPYEQEHRGAGLIFSGLYNSRSGVNNLNQFIIAQNITKDLNPVYGTIQKLHARDTNLTVLMEDKVFSVLADKDALYNADGNTNVTSTNKVLGQAMPYAGEFGISKNPESFASFGFRAYFTDKARGSVIRLSRDGITEINDKGMSRYFQSALKSHTGAIIGAYDEDISSYNVSLNNESVSFKEQVNGWPTRLSYVPEFALSLNNSYYTFKNGEIWEHNNTARSNFYGVQYDTTITPIFNDAPTSIKNFKTLSYEGHDGWVADVITDQQDGEVKTWKKKEGIYFNYINGLQTTWSNATQSGSLDSSEFSVQGIGSLDSAFILAPNVFELSFNGQINVSLQPGDEVYYKDASTGLIILMGNCIAANAPNGPVVVQNQTGAALPAVGDFVFFAKDSEKNTSGIIGYYAQVLMTLSSSEPKELFAVNSEVFISSE